eukprot:2129953-Pyramimonas_sp.AAC.1
MVTTTRRDANKNWNEPHLDAVHALREVLEQQRVLVLHVVPVAVVQLVLEGEVLRVCAVHYCQHLKLHRRRCLHGIRQLQGPRAGGSGG